MEFASFTPHIPTATDIRPFLTEQVRRYIRLNPSKFKNSHLTPAGYIISQVIIKTGYEKKPSIRSEDSKPLSDRDGSPDPATEIINGWNKKDKSKRGDPLLAQATFYWFFRYVSEPSYFIEIAKKTWNINSGTYKRFYYAKKGGSPDDSFDSIITRFQAPEAISEFAKMCVEDEVIVPLLTIETHESNLHYSKAIIKVLGRDAEQKRLHNFLQEEKKGFEWLQLAGVGGQGKSRLAFDLVSDCPQNWYAGFLPEKELSAFKTRWNDWQPTKPTLIVIDYILGHEPDVKVALQTLAKRSEEFSVPVRMLLIERQRWDRGELVKQQSEQSNDTQSDGFKEIEFVPDHRGKAHWFLQLNDRSDGDDVHLTNTMHGKNRRPDAGVVELEQLSIKDLGDITRQVVKELGYKGRIDDKHNEKFLGRIDKQGRPLYAYFLAHAINADNFQLTWTLEDLLKKTLLREYHQRWKSSFKSEPPAIGQNTKSMRYAVLATMIDGLEHDKNLKSVEEALILCDGARGDPALQSTLVPALLPDILGEYFVLLSFEKAVSTKSLAQQAWELSPIKMAAFLQRCAQDFPQHDEVFNLLNIEPKQREGQTAYAGISATIVFYWYLAENKKYPHRLMEALELSADAKDVNAMYILGKLTQSGIGIAKDPKAAFSWYGKAAEIGDSDAMFNLSLCYQQGIGVDADPVEAVKWYRKAATAGDSDAMFNLGLCYKQGIGVDADPVEAVKWFHRGAEAGNSIALFNLGACYGEGVGVDANPAEAVKWYRRAAEAGNSNAMVNLGVCYENGNGVDADPAEVVKLYRKAAEAGNSNAMFNLGVYYRKGSRVAADEAKAVKWLHRAAEAGNSDAMVNLGVYYRKGSGVDTDPAKAVKWYHRAAEAGQSDAMFSLGICYEEGIGVDANPVEAVNWYRKAARAGHSGAKELVNSFSDLPSLNLDDPTIA